MDLVERAAAVQRREGWTDQEMARRLGVSASMWHKVRRRHWPPGRKVLVGMVAGLPELALDVMDYMRGPGGQHQTHSG